MKKNEIKNSFGWLIDDKEYNDFFKKIKLKKNVKEEKNVKKNKI